MELLLAVVYQFSVVRAAEPQVAEYQPGITKILLDEVVMVLVYQTSTPFPGLSANDEF
jgi:hypothetical protein